MLPCKPALIIAWAGAVFYIAGLLMISTSLCIVISQLSKPLRAAFLIKRDLSIYF